MMHSTALTQSRHSKTSLLIVLTLVMMVVLGCATAGSESSGAVPTREQASQRKAAELAFYHSQQAAEFRTLAQRFEVEANWRTRQFGENDEAAMRKRAFANEMRAEAERAARTAEQYRRQVPHAQVY
jgi:hypothetical protein